MKDIPVSIKWYTDVLGFQFIWHSKEEKLAQVNLPSRQMIFLSETDDDPNFTKNGATRSVVGFQANNIEQLYEHLKKHDVRVEEIVHDEERGYKILDFYNLDGNMLNVMHEKLLKGTDHNES